MRFHCGSKKQKRRGMAAVEAAVILPFIVLLMTGVWEAGHMLQMTRTLKDAAREGARIAAGGVSNGTDVTVAMVQTAVQNYLTAAGFPSAAVSGATITLTNNSSNTWTDPCDASPLDPFTVTVTIPAGAAFNSLKLNSSTVTGITSLSAQVQWLSNNDSEVVVSTTLPF